MDGEIGFGLRAVQVDQNLALDDVITFGDGEGLDDAAFAVLHRLAVAVDDKCAAADDSAIQRCERGPRPQATKRNKQRTQSGLNSGLQGISWPHRVACEAK